MNAVIEEISTKETVEVDALAWQEKGKVLSNAHKRHQWKIADWLIEGLALYPEDVSRANTSRAYDLAEELFPEYTRNTLQAWVCVARAFGLSRDKYPNLYFSHFKAVLAVSNSVPFLPEQPPRDSADLPAYKERQAQRLAKHEKETQVLRERWLAEAEERRLSVPALRLAINNVHEIENGKLAPPQAEPETPPAKQPQPTKPKAERGYSLPLSSAHQRALETLAVGRGISPAILAAHAVSEYLNQNADEIAGAAEQQAKQRAAIKDAEDAALAVRDAERSAHDKALKEQEDARKAAREEQEAARSEQQAVLKEQQAAQEAARKEREREIEEIWQAHVEPIRRNDYLFFALSDDLAKLDTWRKERLPSPEQMMGAVKLILKRVEELKKADELRQIAQHVSAS